MSLDIQNFRAMKQEIGGFLPMIEESTDPTDKPDESVPPNVPNRFPYGKYCINWTNFDLQSSDSELSAIDAYKNGSTKWLKCYVQTIDINSKITDSLFKNK